MTVRITVRVSTTGSSQGVRSEPEQRGGAVRQADPALGATECHRPDAGGPARKLHALPALLPGRAARRPPGGPGGQRRWSFLLSRPGSVEQTQDVGNYKPIICFLSDQDRKYYYFALG